MPDQAERFRVLAGDEHHGGITVDRAGKVGQRAVQLHGQRGASQPGADGGSEVGARDGGIKLAHGTVGQGDGGHGGYITG